MRGNTPPHDLLSEGGRLHRLLFRRPASDDLKRTYARACTLLLPLEEQSPLAPLPRSDSALEALELAARRRNPDNTLTRRIHILLYLAEATPDHFDLFIPRRSRRLAAWPLMGVHLIRTLYLWLRGSTLLRRYPLG